MGSPMKRRSAGAQKILRDNGKASVKNWELENDSGERRKVINKKGTDGILRTPEAV